MIRRLFIGKEDSCYISFEYGILNNGMLNNGKYIIFWNKKLSSVFSFKLFWLIPIKTNYNILFIIWKLEKIHAFSSHYETLGFIICGTIILSIWIGLIFVWFVKIPHKIWLSSSFVFIVFNIFTFGFTCLCSNKIILGTILSRFLSKLTKF